MAKKCVSCGDTIIASAIGPQGPTGATGATGPAGAAGAAGAAGSNGADGADGIINWTEYDLSCLIAISNANPSLPQIDNNSTSEDITEFIIALLCSLETAGTIFTFSNGLTETAGSVEWGGSLTGNTTINGTNSYSTTFNNLTTFTVNADDPITLNSGTVAAKEIEVYLNGDDNQWYIGNRNSIAGAYTGKGFLLGTLNTIAGNKDIAIFVSGTDNDLDTTGMTETGLEHIQVLGQRNVITNSNGRVWGQDNEITNGSIITVFGNNNTLNDFQGTVWGDSNTFTSKNGYHIFNWLGVVSLVNADLPSTNASKIELAQGYKFIVYNGTSLKTEGISMTSNPDNTAGLRVGTFSSNARAELDISGTGAAILPVGDTSERPASEIEGMIRYNTDLDKYEHNNNGGATGWKGINGGGSGQTCKIRSISTSGNITLTDHTLLVDCSGASVTLTLPTIATAYSNGEGSVFVIKSIGAHGGNTITIDGNGAETVDGAAGYTGVLAQYEAVTLVAGPSEWHVISYF